MNAQPFFLDRWFTPLRILLSVLAVGTLLASQTTGGAKAALASTLLETNAPCCRKPLPARPPTELSIYQLQSRWTSDFNRQVSLGQFRGRPQVIALFYSHCDFACPLLVARMKSVEAQLAAHPPQVGPVEFILVSLDPERDFPAELHAYRQRQGLSLERWTLLTGAPGSVRELAALLGVQYRKEARDRFAHSNLLTLLNAEGEVVHQSAGLGAEVSDLVEAIQRLAPRESVPAARP